MLASKPAGTSVRAGTGANPAYNLAAVTTRMMWACALATARVTVASTTRSLELWSRMLRGPSGQADQVTAAPPAAGGGASAAATIAAVPRDEASAPGAPADRTPFASYRSSGGHAAAQVIVSD